MDDIIINSKEVAQTYHIPRIGDDAPAFIAQSTQGPVRFPQDFAGKWIILFSHPADFTPVCTSEFMTFARLEKDFTELNTQLVGLSVDGLYSHIAWLRTIKEKIEFRGWKNVEVKFPLIEDITMEVAKRYGMIQPHESTTKAVRAVFFIDPKSIIRAIIYYPLSLGRNFDELKRVIVGLQTVDQYGVALPADWKPGEDVIVPPAGSCGAAEDRMAAKGSEVYGKDWFFCMKPLKLEQSLN
jgi:peroxiredoxin 2/4